MRTTDAERKLLRLGGGLLLAGLLLFLVVTQGVHPHGDENDHAVIFTKYAHSDAWIAAHFGQFAGVLIALAGFVVLYQFLRERGGNLVLAHIALGTTIATAAVWAVLQALDGVALKHAVDAWAAATGPEKSLRYADAETLRWTEWGLQSYFRLLMGATVALFGVALARTRAIQPWLGAVAVLGGVAYMAIGVAVGYTGFEKPGGMFVQLLILTFVVGVLAAGTGRASGRSPHLAT